MGSAYDPVSYTHLDVNKRQVQADLADRAAVESVFAQHKPQRVINLAAQAGVRYAACLLYTSRCV